MFIASVFITASKQTVLKLEPKRRMYKQIVVYTLKSYLVIKMNELLQ